GICRVAMGLERQRGRGADPVRGPISTSSITAFSVKKPLMNCDKNRTGPAVKEPGAIQRKVLLSAHTRPKCEPFDRVWIAQAPSSANSGSAIAFHQILLLFCVRFDSSHVAWFFHSECH